MLAFVGVVASPEEVVGLLAWKGSFWRDGVVQGGRSWWLLEEGEGRWCLVLMRERVG